MDKDKPAFIARDGMIADKDYVKWLAQHCRPSALVPALLGSHLLPEHLLQKEENLPIQ